MMTSSDFYHATYKLKKEMYIKTGFYIKNNNRSNLPC